MAQVFISYAREDRDTAQALAQAFEAAGLTTWWDRALVGGDDFAAEIERQLHEVRVVLVLWSEASVASGFVRDESSRARDANKLLPVRIADVRLPLGFGSLHTLDLLDWDGDADDAACQALVAQVRARVAGQAPPAIPLPTSGGRRALRRGLLAGAGVALLGGAAWGVRVFRQAQDDEEAQRLFEAGQAAQFAREPAFAVARDRYREALRLRAAQPLVHYHLGTVYLRLYAEGGGQDALLIDDAAQQFQAALKGEGELDRSQVQDARRQLALLAQRDDAAPVTRSAAEAPSPPLTARPPPPTAAQPAPAPVPTQPAPRGDFPNPVAASGALADEARTLAQRAFAADRAQRSSAAGELALRPALAGDALAFLLPLAQAAANATASDAERDGVLATLTVLQAASPATLRERREAAAPLLAAAPALGSAFAEAAERASQAFAQRATRRPRVFVQLASEAQRPLAAKIAERMRVAGYQVPAFEVTGPQRAPERTQLRTQGGSSLGLARWCAQATREDTGAPVTLQALRAARPDTDTFELWLGRELGA